jgi:hypothetical protein
MIVFLPINLKVDWKTLKIKDQIQETLWFHRISIIHKIIFRILSTIQIFKEYYKTIKIHIILHK